MFYLFCSVLIFKPVYECGNVRIMHITISKCSNVLVYLTVQCFTSQPGYKCKGHVPVVDNAFLADTPIRLRKAGAAARVPELIGVTREESTLFVIGGTLINTLTIFVCHF